MSKNLKIDGLELSGVDTIEAYDTDSKEYAKFVDTDDANALWIKYQAENNAKATELTTLIAAAKATIREKYPD